MQAAADAIAAAAAGDGGGAAGAANAPSHFKGSTYALIQEQLRNLDSFSGDPKKISWDTFEYKFTSALEVAPDIPDKLKLALLKQKLSGAPEELLRLHPELREQTYDELLSWLALRYQQIHSPQEETRKWQVGDTPDSYLVRIQRNAEIDLPPLPARRIPRRDDNGDLVRDDEGEVIVDINLRYEELLRKRQDYLKTIDTRLKRDYIEGLKPSLKQKLIDPPETLEEVHMAIRRMYIHELKHPSPGDELMTPSKASGLPVFATQTHDDQNKEPDMKAFDGMKDVTKTLAEAMIKMTENGAIKPTARAGTARDPEEPRTLSCFECGSLQHLVKECPIRQAKNIAQAINVSQGTGTQMAPAQRGRNAARGNNRGTGRGSSNNRSNPYPNNQGQYVSPNYQGNNPRNQGQNVAQPNRYNQGNSPQNGYMPRNGPQNNYSQGFGPQNGYNNQNFGPQNRFYPGFGTRNGFNQNMMPQTNYNQGFHPRGGQNQGPRGPGGGFRNPTQAYQAPQAPRAPNATRGRGGGSGTRGGRGGGPRNQERRDQANEQPAVQAKETKSAPTRKEEIMANVAMVLEQLDNSNWDDDSKNE